MKRFVIAFDNQDQVYDALDATEDLGTRVIPLLPEIRESCGLALMGNIDDVDEAVKRLDEGRHSYNGVYFYEREGGKRKVEAL